MLIIARTSPGPLERQMGWASTVQKPLSLGIAWRGEVLRG